MSLNGRLKDEPAGAKLFWLLFISLGFFFVSGLLALLLSEPLFGIDMIGNPSLARDFGDPQVIRAMKFSQTVNAIGFFIIPPILFAWLCGTDLRSFFGLGRPLKLFPIAAAVLLVIAALPLENFVATLSDAIHFPDIIAGWETNLRNMQEETERTVVAFLKMEDLGDLGINLMMVALLPAVGEEMLFRGWFQPLLIQRFRSVHMGIWITAALFSLIHMQFFAFFSTPHYGSRPRLFVLLVEINLPSNARSFLEQCPGNSRPLFHSSGKLTRRCGRHWKRQHHAFQSFRSRSSCNPIRASEVLQRRRSLNEKTPSVKLTGFSWLVVN